jgi:hypothetical protein
LLTTPKAGCSRPFLVGREALAAPVVAFFKGVELNVGAADSFS